jgi:carbon starvation protein CstA
MQEGTAMMILGLVAVAAAALLLGYFGYGRWLAAGLFRLDPGAE